MIELDQAIKGEIERAVTLEDKGHYYEPFTGYRSSNKGVILISANDAIRKHMLLTETVERIRAAVTKVDDVVTEPHASEEPTRIALLDAQIVLLKQDIADKDAEARRLNTEIRQLTAKVTEQGNELKERIEQYEVDRQVIEEMTEKSAEEGRRRAALTTRIENMRNTILKLRGRPEEVDEPGVLAVPRDYYEGLAKANAEKAQYTTNPVDQKPDPFRPVTHDELYAIAQHHRHDPAPAMTVIVRNRIGEAMANLPGIAADTYATSVRTLAYDLAGYRPGGFRDGSYCQICREHHVDPVGDRYGPHYQISRECYVDPEGDPNERNASD